jgi:predicted DNA-binding protein (MmcQ/YjbR family)
MMDYGWLDQYLLSMPGAEKDFKVEWGWVRYMIRGKLYAAIVRDMDPPLLTLKLEPAKGEFYRGQYPVVIPGYYMNKVHWNSVRLDGTVPEDLLREMMDESYRLVLTTLPKKVQAEIVAAK